MNYFRKIIYLDEYDCGARGQNIGFAKLSKKETRLRVELILTGNRTLCGEKIYLLDRDDNAVNKVFFGTITEEGSEVSLSVQTGQGDLLKGRLAGILIGGENYVVCAGTDDDSIRVEDYAGAGRGFAQRERKSAEPPITAGGEEKLAEEVKLAQDEKLTQEENLTLEEEVADLLKEDIAGEEPEEELIQFEMEEAHDAAYMFRKLFGTNPNMYPFEDDEMEQCVQISPAEFSDFPEKYWHLGSNTFLLQGYYNYRHLILARKGDKMYVGIPGQFHRRDKYLADMFGFGRFKCIQKKAERLGDFGYWLMDIEVPPSSGCVECG